LEITARALANTRFKTVIVKSAPYASLLFCVSGSQIKIVGST
jgi:hypothetical protein